MQCPKCGHANPESAYFCTTCHQILIHRCPQCWHEQRAGGVCEKCGTNFALYWQLALARTMEEESRVSWEKFMSGAKTVAQFAFWPVATLAGIVRVLVMRLVAPLFSGR